jgi:hypothetical protein
MAKIESSTREDLIFDGDALTDWEDNGCWLVALDNWEIAVILSSLRYAHWQKRWRSLGGHTWDEIEAKICELEYCLMAGCNVENLIKTNLMMIAAITGQQINLDAIGDDYFTGVKNYTSTGLANRIGRELPQTSQFSLNYMLMEIKNALNYGEKNITQIVSEQGSGGNSFTLQEFIDNFDPEELSNPMYAGIYALLNLMKDILPDHLVKDYKFIDPPEFVFNVLNSLGDKAIAIVQTAFQGAEATANTGAAVADIADTAVVGLDTIFQGVTAGALSLSAITDLIGLFTSGKTPNADTDPNLRSLTRVYNDVFVEGNAINVTCSPDVTCAPDVTVNCGGGGGGGYGTPGDGGLGGMFQPPSVDPNQEFSVDQAKCDRVTYLANNFITHIKNVASIAGMTDLAFATGMAFFMNSGGLVMFAFAGVGVAFIIGSMVLGAIIGAIIGVSELAQWASDLETGKDDFICAAYNATTKTALIQAVRDWIEATIPTVATAWIDKYVDFVASGGVCAWVLTGEGFTPPETIPVGDCASCIPSVAWDYNFGASQSPLDWAIYGGFGQWQQGNCYFRHETQGAVHLEIISPISLTTTTGVIVHFGKTGGSDAKFTVHVGSTVSNEISTPEGVSAPYALSIPVHGDGLVRVVATKTDTNDWDSIAIFRVQSY